MAEEAKKIRTESGNREQDLKMDTQFRNPNAASTIETGGGPSLVNPGTSAPSTSGNVELTDTYKEKLKDYRGKIAFKKNHIWGEIANAEAVEQTVKQFDVVSMVDVFSILRGPETYVVGNKRKRKLPEEGEETPTRVADDDYESDSSVSSGGLSDDTNKDIKLRYAARKSSSLVGRKIIKSRKRIINDTTQSPRSGDSEMMVDVKPKKKSVGRSILEEKMAEMPDRKLAIDMANRLNERKKYLFSNAMKLLGRETCIKLFFKTLKIERLGGITIMKNSRRRTPGGVFLYMSRNDSRLPQETVLGRTLAKFDKSAELEELSLMEAKIEVIDSDVEADEIENSYDLPATHVQADDNAGLPADDLKLLKREKIVYDDIP